MPRPASGARAIGRSVEAAADVRRLVAALLSAVVPGLGQALNGRTWLATRLALPFLALAGVVAIVVATQSPVRLIATVVAPTWMTALLVLNGVVLVWRVGAVLHAFFDRRYPARSGRLGGVGVAVLVALVIAPHLLAHGWGTAANSTFQRVFSGNLALAEGSGALPAGARDPGFSERINMLIIGIDKTPDRTATLTDTMMVLSVDPVGETVSMLSLPRDVVDVPLGNGDRYTAKLNSLYSYADRHPEEFPDGGLRALEDAIGALLGIPIHYYALMDFVGFVKMVDAVGGVDLDVARGFYDPEYDGYGFQGMGWGIEPGLHHFNGFEALAYARARKGATETDFTRAARQQEILLALRDKALSAGSLVFHVPDLLETVGEFIQTDLPPGRLPELAAIADEMNRDAIVRTVLQRPYVQGGVDERGSIQRPQLDLIAELAGALFPAPGTPPTIPPTPAP
jgi:LCP family protein required for cell wall assembly